MSDNEEAAMSDNEAWLALDDPTNGELPATDFIGTKKDLEQTKPNEEGDGSDIAEVPSTEIADEEEAK